MNSKTHILLVSIMVSILLTGCYNIKFLFYKPTSIEFTRDPTSVKGSMFIRQTSYLSQDKREERIYDELTDGNMPIRLKNMTQISYTERGHRVTLWVAKDYLSIGSDSDYVRIPMRPATAEAVARYYGMGLPTAKIVDKIYQRSTVKLAPSYLSPGPSMSSNGYYKTHNDLINRALKNRWGLISGHKKDIVITNKLMNKKPKRVAIYGWHRPNGKPVQPLSVVHDSQYVDYSHGVRLISRKVMIDSVEYSYESVLKNKA